MKDSTLQPSWLTDLEWLQYHQCYEQSNKSYHDQDISCRMPQLALTFVQEVIQSHSTNHKVRGLHDLWYRRWKRYEISAEIYAYNHGTCQDLRTHILQTVNLIDDDVTLYKYI